MRGQRLFCEKSCQRENTTTVGSLVLSCYRAIVLMPQSGVSHRVVLLFLFRRRSRRHQYFRRSARFRTRIGFHGGW